MNWEDFQSKKLGDIGSRYLHYSELISVWEECAELIIRQSYIGKDAQAKYDALTTSIELIRNTLDGMGEYHDAMLGLRKLVDQVPLDVAMIPGGRGSQLRLGSGGLYEDIT